MISAFVFLHGLYNSSSTYTLNFKILAFFCGFIGRFVLGLVGSHEDWFSPFTAHMFQQTGTVKKHHFTFEMSRFSHVVLTKLTLIYNAFCLFVRYESNSGGEREIQRTMLELLNQLDGFDSRGDVKVKIILL